MSKRHAIVDESKDHSYFIITPQLVWALARDPYDFALWGAVKMIAGEAGECYLATEELAVLAMMSVGKLSDCRAYLLECGLLTGELRKDPGYPQPVWHLQVPDIWAQNLAWRQNLGDKLDARIEYKREQKKSLHQVKAPSAKELSPGEGGPPPGEGGPPPGEGGPPPGEGKENHKENHPQIQEGEPAMGMAKLDPLTFGLERRTAEVRSNWAVPLDAGGDDSWKNGPVDSFARLVGLNPVDLPKKKRLSWAKELRETAAQWSTDDRSITAEAMQQGIDALIESRYGWKAFSSPFEQGFKNAIGIVVLGGGQAQEKPKVGAPMRYYQAPTRVVVRH